MFDLDQKYGLVGLQCVTLQDITGPITGGYIRLSSILNNRRRKRRVVVPKSDSPWLSGAGDSVSTVTVD